MFNTFCPFLSKYSETQGFVAIPCVKEGEGVCIFYDKVKLCCKIMIIFDNIESINKKLNEKK